MRARLSPGVLIWLAATGLLSAQGDASEASRLSFLGEGNAQLSFRYRLEAVNQDGLAENARASTLRTRLTYTTPAESKVQLLLEADSVLRLGAPLYSNGNQANPGYPVVADPTGTEVNQAYLKFTPAAASSFVVGRQRINFDDQRFIGGVGWRQNEQTYDAVRADFRFARNTKLALVYLWNINRIFGPDGGAQASDWACRCYVLNFSAPMWEGGKFVGFAYELDIEDAISQANRTLGFRFSGKHKLELNNELSYLFSYATQTEAGRNVVDYRASYLHGQIALQHGKTRGRAGLELLGGDRTANGSQFVTPFATLHAFNGWADKFLGIPQAGIKDLYLGVDLPIGGANASVVWHRFSAEDGGADYGTEWDLSVAKEITKGLAVLGKLADFDSKGFAADTTKAWLMLSYTP